jgi:hypothetical protein
MTAPLLPPAATFAHWWTSAPSAVSEASDAFLKARGLSRLEDIPPADWQTYATGVKSAAKASRVFAPPGRPAPKPSLPGDPMDLVTGKRL